jgi:hypothetical protein
MSIKVEHRDVKRRCPRCKEYRSKGGFTKDNEICNLCLKGKAKKKSEQKFREELPMLSNNSELECFGKKYAKMAFCKDCKVANSCGRTMGAKKDTQGKRRLVQDTMKLIESKIKESGDKGISTGVLLAKMAYDFGISERVLDKNLNLLEELGLISHEFTSEGIILKAKKDVTL